MTTERSLQTGEQLAVSRFYDEQRGAQRSSAYPPEQAEQPDRDSVRQVLARLLFTIDIHDLTGLVYQRADAETGRVMVTVADPVHLEAWRAVLPGANEALESARFGWFDVNGWAPGWNLTVQAPTAGGA